MGTTPLDNGFVAHCMELLDMLGPMRAKRMFGGYGLYAEDLFVAIITSDQLYLKTDAQTRPRFEAAGCAPFRYERRAKDGKVTVAALGYFQPPEEALESAALMAPWARLAMEAALRAANDQQTLKASAPARSRATGTVKPLSGAAAKSRARKAG
ncbi:TfoX/Sxy family protein [Roseateles sp. SL47]|uniref:TfoX/Sxy family protein n=1 Tax=Roseateles sp. SL47 TaxID=2995138 RepID=UPI0022708501|nr:TfoX/Sxy family protein [Roseateles sp. SL47]WAC73564.1 TfoX/Sxy family protein [Roseateles sp. SL47]